MELAQRITVVPSWRKLDSEIARLREQIEANGWIVEFPRWCEDHETPGILGQASGVTVHERAAIKVKTQGASREQVVAVLQHEIEHMHGARNAADHPCSACAAVATPTCTEKPPALSWTCEAPRPEARLPRTSRTGTPP
jgi:hypothetical protein